MTSQTTELTQNFEKKETRGRKRLLKRDDILNGALSIGLDSLTMKNLAEHLNVGTATLYQYFENRFGIKVLGALTVNPDVLPGAEQLSEIREVIEHEKVNCLFSEPQFNPAIIKSIAKDTKIKTGVLDPLGATLDKGKGMYSELLQSMYASFKGC